MADQANATDTPAPKKTGVCSKVYIDAEGKESRSATPDADRLEFRFTNGSIQAVHLDSHNKNILTCLAWFGISEKYGNSYAGAKGDAEVAEESFLSMQEQLSGDQGVWVERAEGVGPRPSLVADAVIAALTAKGEKVNDERATKIREAVKDKAVREGALKDPAIKAAHEAAKAKRAAERAKAFANKAKGVKMEATGF